MPRSHGIRGASGYRGGGATPPSPFYLFPGAARRCHPERARGTRASEGPACGRRRDEGCAAVGANARPSHLRESRSFAPAARSSPPVPLSTMWRGGTKDAEGIEVVRTRDPPHGDRSPLPCSLGVMSRLPEVLPDALLVQRMAALSDRTALAELDARHGMTLYALAYGLLFDGEAADVAVAMALREAWRSAAAFDARTGTVVQWLAAPARAAT